MLGLINSIKDLGNVEKLLFEDNVVFFDLGVE